MAANPIAPTRYHRSPHRSTVLGWFKFVLVVVGLVWFFVQGTQRIGYHWQWYRVPRYLFPLENGRFLAGPLLQGLKITVQITGISLLLAFALGVITALMRLSRSVVAKCLARLYLELVRNTPLLTSQGVSLIKDSALVSTVAIYDLTIQGQVIVADTFLTFEIWITIGAVYGLLTLSCSLAVARLETSLRRRGRKRPQGA
jgi:ABC-type amino acid transport system permease subunit